MEPLNLSREERDAIERVIAKEILFRHRKWASGRTLGGMLTGASCVLCGGAWRCRHVEWADEILLAQASFAPTLPNSRGGWPHGSTGGAI